MRSPTRKQLEEPVISASKLSVLFTEEEGEDGEIKESNTEDETVRHIIGEEDDTHVVEELTGIKLPQDDSQKVRKQKGTKKVQNKMLENSALVPDANPVAMSTRSSRRQH